MLEIKRNVFSILDFPEIMLIGRNKESELSHAALSIISLIFCSRKEETAICLAKLAANCTEKRTRERERERERERGTLDLVLFPETRRGRKG